VGCPSGTRALARGRLRGDHHGIWKRGRMARDEAGSPIPGRRGGWDARRHAAPTCSPPGRFGLARGRRRRPPAGRGRPASRDFLSGAACDRDLSGHHGGSAQAATAPADNAGGQPAFPGGLTGWRSVTDTNELEIPPLFRRTSAA
jgi:hypothetical protein